MFLVVSRLPTDAQALAAAARVTGLSPFDVRQRLAGTLPRVLLTDATGERFTEWQESLARLGFECFACDPRLAPRDDDRFLARHIELRPNGIRVSDDAGTSHDCPSSAVLLLQRGLRLRGEVVTTTTKERKFAPGRALLSGGLLLTKKVETQTTVGTESREFFAVLHRGDGEPDIAIYEQRLDYRFLGTAMQASSRANFEQVLDRILAVIRERSPGLATDDRAVHPAYAASLPLTSVDRVDLALHLILLAHTHGRAR